MKNRTREICTSGSVRDEDGQPPHLLGHRRQFGSSSQKWSNISNLGRSRRRRWRGVALGGHLQRGCRFCLAGHNGQATTGQNRGVVPAGAAGLGPSDFISKKPLKNGLPGTQPDNRKITESD